MKTILLIEDNDDIRTNTAEILELSGYKVSVAENGKLGLQKAIAIQPDLIICDIMMPELDGYGVLHAVQRNESIKYTPFIFLTAKTERNDFRKAMDQGADDYITKPFEGTELLKAISCRFAKAEALVQEKGTGTKNSFSQMQVIPGNKALYDLTLNRNINKYKKKQYIYTQGNLAEYLYYVIKGKVKTFKSNENGKELITELFSAGDFLGYVTLLEDTVYKESAEALESTDIAIIPRKEFDQLVTSNPEVSKKLIQMLAKNASSKEVHLLNLAYNSLRKKVAKALLSFQDKFSDNKDSRFHLDISRDTLATMAGTAKESLIRTLGDFNSEQLITLENGVITIINENKLKNLIN